MDNSPIKIAIVGMTGAGKTVLISTLAMKMSQMANQGIFLAPVGENRRQTLRYVQENWQTLNSGKWPPSTSAEEWCRQEWELTTKTNAAIIRFADCAGQGVQAFFKQEQFDYNSLTPDQQYIYNYLRSANVLIFLINMEDILGRSPKQALENALDVDQMFYVLNQKANFPRKTALVLSQFDKYRDELKAKYDNNLLEYLRANFPQLQEKYINNPNFAVIPIAAVETTQNIIENESAKLVPVEKFLSFNLEMLITWIADSVDELAPLIQQQKESSFQEGLLDKSDSISTTPAANSQIKYANNYSCLIAIYSIISIVFAVLFFRVVTNNPESRSSLCLFPTLTPGNSLSYFLALLTTVSVIKTILLAFETHYLAQLKKETDEIKYCHIEKKLRSVIFASFLIFSGFVIYVSYVPLLNLTQRLYYLCILPSVSNGYGYFMYSLGYYFQWRRSQYSNPRITNLFGASKKFETLVNLSLFIIFLYIIIPTIVFVCLKMNAFQSVLTVNILLVAAPVISMIVKILKQRKNKDQ